IRGAARSKGGKPIIALPSTVKTKKGHTYSRIVPFLEKGAGVVTSEGDVQFVVTEFGVAQLNHKAVGERAKELIKISHPNFQEELERVAFESGYKVR
ncbi:4-hydroxybutyrate CoA-transferase, partial [bacterium]|nr:4-hydroxybutyrate CoA-transferase [bacterium]